MVITQRPKILFIVTDDLVIINGECVETVSVYKYLGTFMDSKLNWNSNTESLSHASRTAFMNGMYPFRAGTQITFDQRAVDIIVMTFHSHCLCAFYTRMYMHLFRMIHAVDWMPTIVSAAGGTPETTIDGMSHWDSIRYGLPSSRTEFIYNIDDFEFPDEGVGDYKLILGYPGGADGWHRPMNSTQDDKYEQTVYLKGDQPVQLFNLREDPSEHKDLAQQMPDMVAKSRARFEDYKTTMVPANFPDPDPASDPRKFGDVWSPGWC